MVAANDIEIPKRGLHRWLWVIAVILGVMSLVAEFGFRRPPLPLFWLHLSQLLALGLLWWQKIYTWRNLHRKEFTTRKIILDAILIVLVLLACLVLPARFSGLSALFVCWRIMQVYLLILILILVVSWTVLATATGRAPTRVLLFSFAGIILAGSVLLMLPASHRHGRLSFTDAVFTATSATCVTGLIVRDTGGDFTRLGQTIILILMQIGGLGIMIFGALFALLLGSPLSMRESVAMQDIMNEQAPGRIGRIIIFICLFTFLVELLGVCGIYGMWPAESPAGGPLFKSIFHTVSAFCNAGFSLQRDSLTSFSRNWRIYLVICPLIILGGLGFPVLNNMWRIFAARAKCLYRKPAQKAQVQAVRLSLHSKIVLTATLLLLVGGCLMLVLLELARPDQDAPNSFFQLTLDSFFNSVTARTAGFNTVDIAHLSAASKLVLILLMCIGGSPSSTAGGIKTVTLVVMVMAIYATMRRRPQVHIFHRTVPMMIIRRVATLIILYGLLLWLVTLLLTITENSMGKDLLDLLFESASALGTVGLSTGVTSRLSVAGKWVIIFAMFVGRLGPLSLLAALTFNTRPVHYEYPQEPLVVG